MGQQRETMHEQVICEETSVLLDKGKAEDIVHLDFSKSFSVVFH